ncbi:hypothetical protein J6590_028585 [Homalodisca vitripennis]|nr:hypothetical protein J6590_028585 [Homalodisca vitripennis]
MSPYGSGLEYTAVSLLVRGAKHSRRGDRVIYSEWKVTRLDLIPKAKAALGSTPSTFRPLCMLDTVGKTDRGDRLCGVATAVARFLNRPLYHHRHAGGSAGSAEGGGPQLLVAFCSLRHA